MRDEKVTVTLLSIIAALLLTVTKLIVGFSTNSLGILSEALHSGFDLIATLITFYGIRFSLKPADKDHHFGHGKIEHFSALIQSALLFITCIWIVSESIHRLLSNDAHAIKISIWSYMVILLSICIDYWRSRSLKRVAKKYNNQALEADALHFSSDMLSSLFVLLGLVGAQFGYWWVDIVAALVISIIVFAMAIKLAKQAIDILLDKSPEQTYKKIENIFLQNKKIVRFHGLKVRRSGEFIFVNICIHIQPNMSIQHAHDIMDEIELELKTNIPNCHSSIHVEPEGHHD
ncbi:MAG: cation diffusion facilitator family transporter [Chitinophagaceae bacterium]